MKRSLLVLTAAIMAFSTLASEAIARPHDDDYDRWNHRKGWHHPDRRDRYNDRYWHGRHYNYRPYTWQTVTVYNQPEYYNPRYSEIRCTNTSNPFGALLGAGLGGLAGSTIGSGTGRGAAIVGGALLGGIVGDSVTRQRCTEHVYTAPLGQPVSWQAGPNEGYAVVPVREYNVGGQYCREYQNYATVGGRRHETYGTACRQPDGSWQIIN